MTLRLKNRGRPIKTETPPSPIETRARFSSRYGSRRNGWRYLDLRADRRWYLVVGIPASHLAPHLFRRGKETFFYRRVGAANNPMDAREIKEWQSGGARRTCGKRVSPGALRRDS
jgi:hypothetical protein